MPIDPVPWAVGGAEHSVDVGRQVSYNAADGNEGVVGGTDCEVRALDVAGTAVRVLPGAFNVLNRTPGYSAQMYMGRAIGETVVDVAATGTGEGRSDLVVVEIMDPNLSGSPYQPPVDLAFGPYVRARVISGVDPSTETVVELGQGLNAIPLARLDVPASTGTITQAMITDLRTVARPHSLRDIYTYALTADEVENQTAVSASGEYWPNLARWDIRVPQWATRAKIVGAWVGVLQPPGNVWGRLWVGIGSQTEPNTVTTQQVRYDSPNATGNSRAYYEVAGEVRIPAEMRGRVQRVGLRAVREGQSSVSAQVAVDWASAIKLDIQWQETPDTNQIGV